MPDEEVLMLRRRYPRALALFLALALVAAACGDDDNGVLDPGNGTGPGEPQVGGTITVGVFSNAPGLDPAKLAGGGTVGGMEMGAIYDYIVRYNPETTEYEPRTAESVEANDDFSQWTVRLRAGIRFGDGTPYDAEAVKFAVERIMREGNASPRGQLNQFVESIEVVDPLTVRFSLRRPWSDFPYLLAGPGGLVYSRAAFERAGENFNTQPGNAGAGPFRVRSYRPGEVLELERNPDYYGGPVYLDTLRFVLIPGPAATFEAIRANTLQAGFVRDPVVVNRAQNERFRMVEMPAVAGNMIHMNSGGGATADVRVRRAVAHAVDPRVLNQRVYEGQAQPDSAPFANFPWDPEVEGPRHDPALARRLVQEAKADGWNGRIRLLAGNDPVGTAWALAIEPQLREAGMDVAVDTSKDIQQVVAQVLVQQDYELTTWAYGLLDEHPANYIQLIGTFGAQRYGYGPPEMVEAVEMLRTAETDDERTQAYARISEIWTRDVPAHVITQIPQALVHSPRVRGPVRTAGSNILFDKVWIER
jgi:peptide/nickel transport system substrate-binding protein